VLRIIFFMTFIFRFSFSKLISCRYFQVATQALPIVGSRKRISLLRSHGTVLENLPSHDSSCSITNVINNIVDVPIASDEKAAEILHTFSLTIVRRLFDKALSLIATPTETLAFTETLLKHFCAEECGRGRK
jgi:hypothetical protein